MIKLESYITIDGDSGQSVFPFCNTVEIVSTWENFTDTAKLIMPAKIRYKNAEGNFIDPILTGENSLWKRGDEVNIRLGYDGTLDHRFSGYLTRIHPKRPLEFECQDKMWTLKQVTIPKYTKTVTLKQLLTDILPSDIEFQAEDITLGKFRITKATVVEVLNYIKKTYGLSAYFQDGVLYAGFAYKLGSQIDSQNIYEFTRYVNIIDDSKLDYIREDDINLKVTAISIQNDNTKKEVTVGDDLGEQRMIYAYNVDTATLTKLANEALEKYKYEGYRGSFTTFLQPYVKHGQAVKLVDNEIPERTGTYLVRQVTTRAGMEGGRQEIFLDRKISG
jgi:hypothetical protein